MLSISKKCAAILDRIFSYNIFDIVYTVFIDYINNSLTAIKLLFV